MVAPQQRLFDGAGMDKIPMTMEGFSRLDAELKRLKTIERPEVIKQIAAARGHGDLSENAEYHAAREKQGFIEGRLAELEDKLRRAEVIDTSALTGRDVKFGAKVRLADEDTDEKITYQIVGEDEADIKRGKISITSPIARALIGKSSGERADVHAPGGVRSYEILDVKYV
jgi:transcription elongation factor GreA